MKKKTRSIVVDNRNYDWTVVEDEWPNGTLKIWKDGKKNNMWVNVSVLVTEPIKPSHVAAIIKKAL